MNYLAVHVVQALAEDRRSNVMGVQVEIVEARLFLMGQVETEEQRRVAELVARELAPAEIEVVNQLWVPSYDRPAESERLR